MWYFCGGGLVAGCVVWGEGGGVTGILIVV